MTEDIIFKEEDFTEDELMLLKMAFKLVETVVDAQRTSNSDVHLVNELYNLKETLGISRIVNDFY